MCESVFLHLVETRYAGKKAAENIFFTQSVKDSFHTFLKEGKKD